MWYSVSTYTKCLKLLFNGGDTRIWTGDQSFADSCLTTWLCRHTLKKNLEQVTGIGPVTKPWQGLVLPLNYTCNSNTLLIYQKYCHLSILQNRKTVYNKDYALLNNLIPLSIALFLRTIFPNSISLFSNKEELLQRVANSEIEV